MIIREGNKLVNVLNKKKTSASPEQQHLLMYLIPKEMVIMIELFV
jgi:hypothetical protein